MMFKFGLFKPKKAKDNNYVPYEYTTNELALNTPLTRNDSAKCIVGPLFFFGSVVGVCKGLFHSVKTLKHIKQMNKEYPYPKKILMTTFINIMTEHSLKCANAFGGIGLVYFFTKQGINFMFEQQIKKLNTIHRNTLYGFVSGMVYKSTRGIGPSLLCGVLFGNCCYCVNSYIEYRKKKEIKKIIGDEQRI